WGETKVSERIYEGAAKFVGEPAGAETWSEHHRTIGSSTAKAWDFTQKEGPHTKKWRKRTRTLLERGRRVNRSRMSGMSRTSGEFSLRLRSCAGTTDRRADGGSTGMRGSTAPAAQVCPRHTCPLPPSYRPSLGRRTLLILRVAENEK